MKQKHRKNAPGWVAKVAAEYGVDDRTARRWKRAGCPADMDKLRQWLASRRQLPVAAVKLPKVTPAPTAAAIGDKEQPGAAPALTRMARQELSNWRTLQAAIEGGDPIAVKTAHGQWLATADTLRRLDLAVEVARRDSGELHPVAELKRGLGLVLYGTLVSLHAHDEHISADALIAGVLPVLCGVEDGWLHDVIERGDWHDIAQFDVHLLRAVALYVECLAAARVGATADTDEGRALAGIINRALARIGAEKIPAPLPREQYEEQAFQNILARYRAEHPEEYAPQTDPTLSGSNTVAGKTENPPARPAHKGE